MKVELPNGTVIDDVPDGTTKDQIKLKAISSGLATEEDFGGTPEVSEAPVSEWQPFGTVAYSGEPTAAAGLGSFLDMTPEQRQAQSTSIDLGEASPQQLAEDTSALGAATISAGEKLYNLPASIQSAFGDEEAQATIQAREKELEPLREEHPAATMIGSAIGEAAPYAVGGVGVGAVKSLLPRIIAGAGLGAAEGATIIAGEGGDVGQIEEGAGIGAAVAGAAEIAIPVVGRLVGKVYRKLRGKDAAKELIDNSGILTKEGKKTIEDAGISSDELSDQAINIINKEAGAVDPNQAVRSAALQAEGLTPTKAQITRKASDFQAQQEAAKTSGRVREALEAQDAALTTRFNQAVLDTKGTLDAPTSTVTDALVNKATKLDQDISELYKAAREVSPDAKNIKFDRLNAKLKQLSGSDRAAGGAVSSISGELKARGIIDNSGKVVGKIDVKAAEELRKSMNALYDPQNGFRNGILREMKDVLDDDVFKAAGEDIFKKGRMAKAKFEGDLTRANISKFDSRRANLVRDVLENKINPDSFTNDVVFSKKWRAEDIKQLKSYISTEPNGVSAFNDLRADTLDTIKRNAFTGAEDAAGNKTLSRAALQRQVDRIGAQKMNILFDKEERSFLKRMLNIAKIREPVSGTAMGKGPSAQAIAGLEKKLKSLPVLGSLVDIINLDAQGRIALKGGVKKIPRKISSIEQNISGVAPVAALPFISEE